MIARLTPYRSSPDAVPQVVDEIVTVARARSSSAVNDPNRRVEFFFLDLQSGDGLSVVIGEDRTMTPVIELERARRNEPEEYAVRLLQLGGPRHSGVVPALFARVVRCDPEPMADLSFDGDAVPTSADVWARALLVGASEEVLAFAVATDRAALEESLRNFSAYCTNVNDYDDVAYHFWRDRS